MYTVIENLINFKFYKNVEEISNKLIMYNSYNVLPDEDYKKLMDLAIAKYELVKPVEEVKKEENVKVEEKPVEKPTEIKPVETINTNVENKAEEVKTEVVTQ